MQGAFALGEFYEFFGNIKIKLNLPVLKQLDTAQQTALRKTTDELLTQIKNSQVIPFDTGNLQNESTFADYANLAEGETKIVSSTPYD